MRNNYEYWLEKEMPPLNKTATNVSNSPKPPYKTHPDNIESIKKAEQIDRQLKESKNDAQVWLPVSGSFPRLIYQTQNSMGETSAPDMLHGNESKEVIESYGFMKPFKQQTYRSPRDGMMQSTEDQFTLPASEHFKRMRSLSDDVLLWVGFSMFGPTSGLFSKMVDKFEANQGGYYSHPLLDDGLRDHVSTQNFHKALLSCLSENIKDGVLTKNFAQISSQYMHANKIALPHFDIMRDGKLSPNVIDGTVLTVHGIWALNVYVDSMEYKGDKIRGKFRYEIEDHFGLDGADIDHPSIGLKSLPFEKLSGFRSWYILQHYKPYNYQPFITSIRFKL